MPLGHTHLLTTPDSSLWMILEVRAGRENMEEKVVSQHTSTCTVYMYTPSICAQLSVHMYVHVHTALYMMHFSTRVRCANMYRAKRHTHYHICVQHCNSGPSAKIYHTTANLPCPTDQYKCDAKVTRCTSVQTGNNLDCQRGHYSN